MPETLKNISQTNLRMQRGPVAFGDVLYGPGGVCGPRIQRDYQLVVMHRGVLDLKLDSRKIRVPAGQAILLSPRHREHFRFTKTGETHHSWCAIAPTAIPTRLRTLFSQPSTPAPFGRHLANLLDMGKIVSAGEFGNELLENGYAIGIGLALFCGFACEAGQDASDDSGVNVFAKFEGFIARHYTEPLKLVDMAAASGISRQHLMRLFKRHRSITPTEYLYKKRLDAAVDLLSHTGLRVGEIANRCGFVNAFHFSRKFRQSFGESPREWRSQLWGKDRQDPGTVARNQRGK